jgi:hypothetical protein
MSTYQGQCGWCDPVAAVAGDCPNTVILPTDTAQFSGSELVATRASATVYFAANQSGQTQFKSGADYMQYKKALALSGSSSYKQLRPPPSSAVAELKAAGCPPQ